MDPAGVLLSVATLLITIDAIQEAYKTASDTLFSIRSQLKTLETGLQRIQEWQHYTDPTSKAQVMHSLGDAIGTVTGCVLRLQEDLDASTRSSQGSSKLLGRSRKTEARLKTHLTDVRECVSLIHFSLAVCQLPGGRDAEREVGELRLGAEALSRAHTSTRRRRQSLIKEQRSEQGPNHSADWNNFLRSVLNAEEGLEDDPAPDSPIRHSSWGSPGLDIDNTPGDEISDPEDLYSPVEEATLSSTFSRDRSTRRQRADNSFHSYQDGHTTPTRVPGRTLSSSSTIGPGQVFRKPVQRMSMTAESIMSDATLEPGTATEKSPGLAGPSGYPPQQLMNGRGAASSSNTGALFNEASQSLNSLAQQFETVGMEDNNESPPSYANVTSSETPPVRDVKRRDTQSSTNRIEEESMDILSVVRDGRVDDLLVLLDQGVGIDEVDPITKRTAIMESACLRKTKISQILLRSGSRLHLKDADGNTALHFAAANGDANTCVLILNGGAQLDEYNKIGKTPLDLAARGGHTEAVICLLNSWTIQNGHAATLVRGFLEASKSGNVSTAQAFIERGVRAKKLNESWKPVAYAAQSGSIPMIDLMLAQKCNLKDRSPDGWTALHFAAQSGHTPMVERLLSWKLSWKAQTKKLQETPLHLAILAGHTQTAMALILHKDANISVRDADDQQPLHHAVRNGDIQLTATLLNRGAKLDSQTKYGWTPVHIAAAYGHLPLVAEFITRGVSIEEKLDHPSFRSNKKTNEAARKGYWCEIRWPHVAARPLHLALEFGYDDVANILIASGAKTEEGDCKGWQPLHYAAWNCRYQLVELLLQRGVAPHATTNDGNTAVSLGFREPGLVATIEDKERVWGLLQAAMNSRRKSSIRKLTGIMNAGLNKTREVGERNKAWHTAELAAALYQNGQLEDGDSESDLQLTSSKSSAYRGDVNSLDDRSSDVRAPSARLSRKGTD